MCFVITGYKKFTDLVVIYPRFQLCLRQVISLDVDFDKFASWNRPTTERQITMHHKQDDVTSLTAFHSRHGGLASDSQSRGHGFNSWSFHFHRFTTGIASYGASVPQLKTTDFFQLT